MNTPQLAIVNNDDIERLSDLALIMERPDELWPLLYAAAYLGRVSGFGTNGQEDG